MISEFQNYAVFFFLASHFPGFFIFERDQKIYNIRRLTRGAGTHLVLELRKMGNERSRESGGEHIMYLFGQRYVLSGTSHQGEPVRIPYLCYRKNFTPTHVGGYTTDTGWGCMYRVSQMLIAHVLVRSSQTVRIASTDGREIFA